MRHSFSSWILEHPLRPHLQGQIRGNLCPSVSVFSFLNKIDLHGLQLINNSMTLLSFFLLTLLHCSNGTIYRLLADVLRRRRTILQAIFFQLILDSKAIIGLSQKRSRQHHAWMPSPLPHKTLPCLSSASLLVGGWQEEKFFFLVWNAFFQNCERFLIMYLKPVRRSGHDID